MGKIVGMAVATLSSLAVCAAFASVLVIVGTPIWISIAAASGIAYLSLYISLRLPPEEYLR